MTYIGLVDDHYQGWILDMGLPARMQARAENIWCCRLATRAKCRPATCRAVGIVQGAGGGAGAAVGGNVPAAMDALRRIKVYPLREAANFQADAETFVDTTRTQMDSTSLRWEDNIQFWESAPRHRRCRTAGRKIPADVRFARLRSASKRGSRWPPMRA